jgi:hypothetical protein
VETWNSTLLCNFVHNFAPRLWIAKSPFRCMLCGFVCYWFLISALDGVNSFRSWLSLRGKHIRQNLLFREW